MGKMMVEWVEGRGDELAPGKLPRSASSSRWIADASSFPLIREPDRRSVFYRITDNETRDRVW